MNSMIEEGKTVPKFQLEDANGKVIKSSQLKGKKFVVYFYPRDFTPGCTTEADEFSKDYKKFQKEGIEIIGISKDDVTSHKKFCNKMNIPYILLADVDTEVCKQFGVWGLKKFMGKEFMGQIRSTFLIKDNKVLNEWRNVRVKDHAKEVLNFLKEKQI